MFPSRRPQISQYPISARPRRMSPFSAPVAANLRIGVAMVPSVHVVRHGETAWSATGKHTGRTDILAERPGWLLFRDGCPNGEQPADVGARADRVIGRLRASNDQAIVFSSGHILRVLAARWLGLAPSEGRLFMLGTASVSILGYEHDKDDPAVTLWNSM